MRHLFDNLSVKLLGQMVRVGVNSPEKLALKNILKGNTSRVGVHDIFEELIPLRGGNMNDFELISNEVFKAYVLWRKK